MLSSYFASVMKTSYKSVYNRWCGKAHFVYPVGDEGGRTHFISYL